MSISNKTLNHGVNPYAILQGTCTLLSAQVIGEVIKGQIMAGEPKTEQEALWRKIVTAGAVIVIIIIILFWLHQYELLTGVDYSGINPHTTAMVAPIPPIKDRRSAVMPLPSTLGIEGFGM